MFHAMAIKASITLKATPPQNLPQNPKALQSHEGLQVIQLSDENDAFSVLTCIFCSNCCERGANKNKKVAGKRSTSVFFFHL